jgi:hypothetical protein
MERRTIVNGFFVTALAGGLAMMVGAASPGSYQATLAISGVAFTGLGMAGLVWLWWTARKDALAMAGDTYNNSGNNFGHMGPVNIGKQVFTLTDDHIREVVQACPIGLPVTVVAIGSQRAFPMQNAIATALKAAGYTVSLDSWAIPVPMPDSPITVDRNAQRTMVKIAPNA